MRLMLLMACAVGLAGTASAQVERVISIRGGPKLAVVVPAGYSFETEANRDGSVRVTMDNPVWNISISALVGVESARTSAARDWQENKLITYIAGVLPDAKESDYNFKPLPLATGTGVFCEFSAADDAPGVVPEPGQFLRFTGGLKAQARSVVIFAILCNDVKVPEYREALDVFVLGFTEL